MTVAGWSMSWVVSTVGLRRGVLTLLWALSGQAWQRFITGETLGPPGRAARAPPFFIAADAPLGCVRIERPEQTYSALAACALGRHVESFRVICSICSHEFVKCIISKYHRFREKKKF